MLKVVNNTIRILIVACIIFAIFGMSIISKDTHHIDICNDDDCNICAIIQMAKILINMMEGVILLYCLEFIIYLLLSKIKSININLESKTLVYLKVQLNE